MRCSSACGRFPASTISRRCCSPPPIGWAMLVVGSAVGGLFAAFSFAISVFSIPMLLDERVDAFTAMGTSMALVWNNLPVMLTWGAIVLGLFLLSLATGLLGLIVVFPVLGHATWHAYAPCGSTPAWRADRPASYGPVMSCCVSDGELALAMADPNRPSRRTAAGQPRHRAGLRQTDLSVPTFHCGGCIQTIEKALGACRASSRRGSTCRPSASRPLARRPQAATACRDPERSRLRSHLDDVAADGKDHAFAELVRALAVAGFAASNIMLLSVSIWSGAESGHARRVPLDLGADRASRLGLFGSHLLSLGLAGAAQARPHQHGRADLDRRAAGLRHEPLRHRPSRTACLFRRLDLAAVLPADRPHARSHDARKGAHRGQRSGAACRPRRWWSRRMERGSICRSTRSNPA